MPSRSIYPLPSAAGCCILVPDFLSASECRELIALSETRGYTDAASDYPPSYRNNDRHVLDSGDLAARLAGRLRDHVPDVLRAGGADWHYAGVNERIRFCRYRTGQRFNVHQDGVHHRGAAHRSHLTLLVYLTDGAAFAGGDTVFYAHGPRGGDQAAPVELGRVRPRAGSLLLFDHAIWHAGADVTAGTKHVLRSDVMYRTAAAAAEEDADDTAHRGYVWTLADLGEGWTASAGRDATIRIRRASEHPTHCLRGHDQSVLGLAPLPGQRLASVSRDRSLRMWDWPTGTCTARVTAHDAAVLDVVVLPAGRLATAGADGLVKLWREDGGAIGTLSGHGGWVWQLAALDGGLLASASEDGDVRMWEPASLRCLAVLAGDRPLRTLLAQGGAIWTGDIDGRMTCWTRGDGGWQRSAALDAHGAAIRRLRGAGDGLVASCGEDGALRVWDLARGAPVFEARHENFVTDALRCADALFSSSYDGRILRHDVAPLRRCIQAAPVSAWGQADEPLEACPERDR